MTNDVEKPTALEGVRVLEMGSGIAVSFAARLLADLGASVVKVESVDGDPLRSAEPLVEVEESGEKRSLLFAFLNWNKRSVIQEVDPHNDDLRRLVAGADIVLEGFEPGRLASLGVGYDTLSLWNPRLVLTSVTNFGQEGEYAHWAATDLILYAMSGLASISGHKYPGAPIKHGLRQSAYAGGLNAAYASLAAYRLAQRTGVGEHVDLSIRECLASAMVAQTGYYVFTGSTWGRHPTNSDPFSGSRPVRAGDGFVCMQSGNPAPLPGYADFLGMPELKDPKFARRIDRLAHAEELSLMLDERLRDEEPVDLFERAAAANLLVGVVQNARQLLQAKHLVDRGFWITLPARPGEKPVPWTFPGEMGRLSCTPMAIRKAEPRLGENTAEVLAELAQNPHPGTAPIEGDSGQRLPVEGLRVVDLSMVVAGPYMGGLLADMGAEVIKVEGPGKLDQTRGTVFGSFIDNDPADEPWNRGSGYNIVNRGKRSFICDLSTERGRELLADLLRNADILLSNFTPRVLRGWGFTAEVVAELNPRLIVVSNTGYGETGPWRNFRAQGTSLEVTTGLAAYTGYRGGVPSKAGQSYPDFIACWNGLVSIFAALVYRERTGLGQWVDQGMLQMSASLLPEAILHYQVHGTELPRMGAADMDSLAGGVFESRDADRWLAVSVRDRRDLNRLSELIPEVASAVEEAEGPDDLRTRVDEALDGYAATRDAEELAVALQAAGLASGRVFDTADMVCDADLMDRGFYESVDFGDEIGVRPLIGRPYRFLTSGERGPRISGTASKFGTDNRYVLQDLLGLDDAEVAALYETGTIADVPTKVVSSTAWDIQGMIANGAMVRFDPDIRQRMAERHSVAVSRAMVREAAIGGEGGSGPPSPSC